MTITLVGMPAVGKSCMGRAIAKKFDLNLIDGDKVIEQTEGRKLQTIMDEDGLDGFKAIEERVLLTIDEDDIVFTPGGSAVYYPKVMEKFKQKGIVVYLYASAEVISNRLVDFSKRGVVLKKGMTMQDLYNERAPLFEKYADITVSCDGTDFPKYRAVAISKIQKYLKKLEQK
jgi:shikimate kinase